MEIDTRINGLYTEFTMAGDKIDRIYLTPEGFERIVEQHDMRALESVVNDISAGMEWRRTHPRLSKVCDFMYGFLTCENGNIFFP